MLFNSITFALFLPTVFILYWFVFQRNIKLQNLFIIAASYFFYGWWDWRFLFLLLISSATDYFIGIKIGNLNKNETSSDTTRKLWLMVSIVTNIGILGFFKYFNFFIDSFVSFLALFGISQSYTTLSIILPVGISFYTFQTLSYTIDVYRRKIESSNDILAFFAFVGFFPLLVAGPIERAANLLPQFRIKRKFDYQKAVDGMRQILWGLFKKIVIADNCATYVNYTFENYQILSGSVLMLGAIFFAFQIYGDFSGYSDIAIGTARLFGIDAMRNFNFPYFSRDIAEFWRRWHISLTTWFRDYVYIPLGGSRVSKSKIIRNTFIIFLLSGFWHGANWTFITWGAFHALLFLPLILLNKNRRNTNTAAEGKFLPNIKELLQIGITFLLVTLSWILFRAESTEQAINYFVQLFDKSLFVLPAIKLKLLLHNLIFISVMLIVEWLQRQKQHALDLSGINSGFVRYSVYLLIMVIIFLFGGEEITFIYFQF